MKGDYVKNQGFFFVHFGKSDFAIEYVEIKKERALFFWLNFVR